MSLWSRLFGARDSAAPAGAVHLPQPDGDENVEEARHAQ